MSDYYIRKPDSQESRGPFDLDKLSSLAGAGQVPPETLLRQGVEGDWAPIGENAELMEQLYPKPKKLGLKSRDSKIEFIEKPPSDSRPPLTVNQMLDAASGHTEETSHLRDKALYEGKAAALALPVLAVMMFLSGVTNTAPRYAVLMNLSSKTGWEGLLREPFALVGVLDFFLAFCLMMNVNKIFPLVRFRAMIGLGYFCFVYWSQGNTMGLEASIAAGLGIFICTLTLNFYAMITFAAIGVLGMGTLAWVAWTSSNLPT